MPQTAWPITETDSVLCAVVLHELTKHYHCTFVMVHAESTAAWTKLACLLLWVIDIDLELLASLEDAVGVGCFESQCIKPLSGVVVLQEAAGLIGDANYWKHEAELQAYKKLFWDTVCMWLVYCCLSAVIVLMKCQVSIRHCLNSLISHTGCFLSSNRQYLSYDGCLEVRGEIIRLFCVVLCTEAVHSHKHT